MSTSGEPPFPKKRVLFSADLFDNRRATQDKKRDEEFFRVNDLRNYKIYDDPDKVRRKKVAIKAGQMLDKLRNNPDLSRDAIATEREKPPRPMEASNLIEKYSDQELADEPNRCWAILDKYFEPLDKFAETVVDQNTAEADILSRFQGKNPVVTDDLARAITEQMDALSEKKPSFQELFPRQVERVKIMQSSTVVDLLDSYTINEWGPGAPYLLALVLGYKERRKLPGDGDTT